MQRALLFTLINSSRSTELFYQSVFTQPFNPNDRVPLLQPSSAKAILPSSHGGAPLSIRQASIALSVTANDYLEPDKVNPLTKRETMNGLSDIDTDTIEIMRSKQITHGMSDAAILTGLNLLTTRILHSPVMIGFCCDQRFFDDKGTFWPDGRYYNCAMRAKQHGWYTPPRRPGEPAGLTAEQRPIYAALNIGMHGNSGWGNSYFVLKPDVIKSIELRSRDTGDVVDGIGRFFRKGHYSNLSAILNDWAKIRYLENIWTPLTSEERQSFKPSNQIPLEAAIINGKGFLDADEIAMIAISINDLKDPENNRLEIERRCDQLGIPVIFHDKKAGQVPFEEYRPYNRVLRLYEHYFQSNTINNGSPQAQSD